MNELEQAHDLVWKFRKEMSEYWPTPTPIDSLRYAFTECGEALSDWLREQRPNHKRNNHHESDVLGELADCAIMLITALNTEDYWPVATPKEHRLETMCNFVADSMFLAGQVSRGENPIENAWVNPTLYAFSWIASHPDMDLIPQIKKRLVRIARKHAPAYKAEATIKKLGLE